MKVLSVKVYAFLILLILFSVSLSLYTFKTLDFTSLNISAILIWSLVAIISESLSVYYVNGSFFISPIEAVFCGCYLSCGPLTAGICIILTFLLIVTKKDEKLWHIFNNSLRYLIFNITHHLIILLTLHRLYLGLLSLPLPLLILPAMAVAPFFFTLSCVLNALFYKIEDDESFKESFFQIFNPYYQTAFPACLAAVIISLAYPRYGILSLLIMLTPIFVTLITMKRQARGEY